MDFPATRTTSNLAELHEIRGRRFLAAFVFNRLGKNIECGTRARSEVLISDKQLVPHDCCPHFVVHFVTKLFFPDLPHY